MWISANAYRNIHRKLGNIHWSNSYLKRKNVKKKHIESVDLFTPFPHPPVPFLSVQPSSWLQSRRLCAWQRNLRSKSFVQRRGRRIFGMPLASVEPQCSQASAMIHVAFLKSDQLTGKFNFCIPNKNQMTRVMKVFYVLFLWSEFCAFPNPRRFADVITGSPTTPRNEMNLEDDPQRDQRINKPW